MTLTINVERLPVRFKAEYEWVITLPFFHGGEPRVRSIFERVGLLDDSEVESLLQTVFSKFSHRHTSVDSMLDEHYETAAAMIGARDHASLSRRRLIGSYFTMEYAIASAALFNPSIVPHPDQTGIPEGGLRFMMSLRATGEGHLSSLVFRTGTIRAGRSVDFDKPGSLFRRARLSPNQIYEKHLFLRKLHDMAVDHEAIQFVMADLAERFTLNELEHAIGEAHRQNPELMRLEETFEGMRWLARENYQLYLPADADISQMVIFPQSDNEIRGIEDLRLVRFVEDDGEVVYYGTYSAYNGYRVLPQLMETTDLRHVYVHTINGECAQNKGMALFPRKIDGHYVMCSRIDGVNLHIMYSDLPQFWETAELLQAPKHPWEFMQIGNCGSPIETSEGWLLLTHGVGPMRTYSIGAMLLD
ncbi:MAG: glycosidase, partial [Pirellulales bacterium]